MFKYLIPKCSLAGKRAVVKAGRDAGREVIIEEWAVNLMGRKDIWSDPRPIMKDLAERAILDGITPSRLEDVDNMVGCKLKPLDDNSSWLSKIYHASELRLLE